jgi:hypothetical protein
MEGEFTNWTADHRLRQSAFKGVREREVQLESMLARQPVTLVPDPAPKI